MRADDGGPSSLRDALGAPEVVEMGVANHDPVGALNVIRSQTGTRSPWDTVDIGIQKNHQRSDREPECGAAIPVKSSCHNLSPPLSFCCACAPAGILLLTTNGMDMKSKRVVILDATTY
ncbi:MAG TPA: hypothetical protein VED37_06355 [Ktedonobacteraceae bacterium]|nr:hypothetical protein [Ktedonobacteraceae bacterium]